MRMAWFFGFQGFLLETSRQDVCFPAITDSGCYSQKRETFLFFMVAIII